MNVLLCIGCNEYDSLAPLSGAEADARRVFESLMGSGTIYDVGRSCLLLSPTLDEALSALRDRLFATPAAQTITFFFAGHACVAQGSLHLALKDTRVDVLSMTALGMARLFEVVAEARPHVANIVLDACQAAGSHYDLYTLLKPDVLGSAGGSSVNFLGACMADQYATENSAGGIATTSLLRHVSGEVRIQDARPTLDLVEVGQAVSDAVNRETGGTQSPACWAVALAGYGGFCANPHFRPGGDHPTYSIDSLSPTSAAGQVVATHSEELWEEHRKLRADWSAGRTHDLLHRVVAGFSSMADTTCFLRGISRSLRLRASQATDTLAESDVIGLAGVQLLPHLGIPECRALARELLDEWVGLARAGAGSLVTTLRANRFALLEGGMGEFHYIPLRVSKLLGWLGALAHVEDALAIRPTGVVQEAAVELWRHYSGSAVAVSDAQAASIYMMISGLSNRCPPGFAKEILDKYARSAVAVGGKFLAIDASSDDIVAYTAIRSGMPVAIDPKSVAQPSELLSVLLQGACALDLTELDVAMEAFDRRWLNSFVPSDYTQFGIPTIPQGLNITQQVGFGVWTLADVAEIVGEKVRSEALTAAGHLLPEGRALCALTSHLLEDRVPYLFPLPVSPSTGGTAPQTGAPSSR